MRTATPRPAVPELPAVVYEETVVAALREDLGRGGDLTSDAIVSAEVTATGRLVARQPGTVAGLGVALSVFLRLDPEVEIRRRAADGDAVAAGSELARLRGRARALLAAERTALNFLGHLSGIATVTRRLADIAAAHGARVADTRKTTPGLRALEKYAVRVGGGSNHRLGLDDAVLIKDNHLLMAGSVGAAVTRTRAAAGHLVKIEVEVDTLTQLDEALAAGADAILLDNMTTAELAEAVRRARGRALLEASGGVTEETLGEVAATGVDVISVGRLTHSAPVLDVAFDLEATAA